MRIAFGSGKHHHAAGVGILLIVAALVAGLQPVMVLILINSPSPAPQGVT